MFLQIQEWIHRFEEGKGARIFTLIFVFVAIISAAVLYDLSAYRNLGNREAMDMAQLGKNIAEGKGYTTDFVRPLSMFLLYKHHQNPELKERHPDIANPPVYPYILAGVFKLIPEQYFKAPIKDFKYYIPDMVIAAVNQVFLLLAGLLLFFLASRLFDNMTAWVVSITFVGTELFWRFSISGLNTMLLIVITLAVAWCLVFLEQWHRMAKSQMLTLSLTVLTGILVGVGGLTRYSYAWLILAVMIFILVFFGKQRVIFCIALLAGFMTVMSPWIVRNINKCGMPFGTATFAMCEGSPAFAQDRLQRSLHPNFSAYSVRDAGRKLVEGLRHCVEEDFPLLGGNWIFAFFLVGLMVPFRRPALSRLRWFVVFSLAVFAVVQSLCRTALSDENASVNADNMLVLFAPIVFLFGVALFFQMLNSVALPFPAARFVIIGLFCIAACVSFIAKMLPPYPSPVAYPPYYPPLIQRIGGWYDSKELLMSDVPWAVAWYGRRQTLMTTLDWKRDFIEITDLYKPIKGLYLTTVTTDTPFLSNWVRGENNAWAAFLLESLVQREVPAGFPLRKAPDGFFPEQLLLSDYERWKYRSE